jgi:hypothetical protein
MTFKKKEVAAPIAGWPVVACGGLVGADQEKIGIKTIKIRFQKLN